jgi:hypothetical protein
VCYSDIDGDNYVEYQCVPGACSWQSKTLHYSAAELSLSSLLSVVYASVRCRVGVGCCLHVGFAHGSACGVMVVVMMVLAPVAVLCCVVLCCAV